MMTLTVKAHLFFHNFYESSTLYNGVFAALPVTFFLLRMIIRKRRNRLHKIPPEQERVLILGASSGLGRSMALRYARRGARVCVVGRREAMLEQAVNECKAESPNAGGIIMCVADFASVDDMVRVRSLIADEWEGLDTMIVSAGVSALKPLMAAAGVESIKVGGQCEEFSPPQADKTSIQHIVNVSVAATQGNYIGPLIAAVTFIPMLANTSPAPSILLISSLAPLIPPPTRSIYASTKSASLALYQALSIEHRSINFSLCIPSTIEGDFRASAVDGGSLREKDPNKTGLNREAVASRCIQAVDNGEKNFFMPSSMRFAHLLFWVWPSLVEYFAARKYNFEL